jgi:hypothetical protein
VVVVVKLCAKTKGRHNSPSQKKVVVPQLRISYNSVQLKSTTNFSTTNADGLGYFNITSYPPPPCILIHPLSYSLLFFMSLGDNKCPDGLGTFYIATNITSYPPPYILIHHHPLSYSSSMSLRDMGHKLWPF